MGKLEAVFSGCTSDNESEMKEKKWNKVKVSDFISFAPEPISTFNTAEKEMPNAA